MNDLSDIAENANDATPSEYYVNTYQENADLWPSCSPKFVTVAAAFAKAQGEISHAIKASENSHFKNLYADLAGVIDAYRSIFASHGLAVLQPIVPADTGVRIQTIILHESGEWLADRGLSMPVSKNDAQGFGSALTYARRYAMAALVGIAQDDDDGNAASRAGAAKPAKVAKPAPTNLAPKPARDKLQARIEALPTEIGAQVRTNLRAAAVTWNQLTVEQLVEVGTWVSDAETVAEGEAG